MIMVDHKPKATITLKSKAATPTVEHKNMPTTNLDQQRAAYAWEKVQGCNSDYTNLAKAAPALIMNNGLMQTLAYYQDKANWDDKKQCFKKLHYNEISIHIRRWLAKQLGGLPLNGGTFVRLTETETLTYEQVMESLLNATPDLYRHATEETLALLRWIRQFAAAKVSG
jgi:CRISPR-associated protein Cmr5